MTAEKEFEAALKRAFVFNGADYIILDGRSGKFLNDGAAYGQQMGWLGKIEERGSDEAQWTEWRLRLTDEGKKHFGIQG